MGDGSVSKEAWLDEQQFPLLPDVLTEARELTGRLAGVVAETLDCGVPEVIWSVQVHDRDLGEGRSITVAISLSGPEKKEEKVDPAAPVAPGGGNGKAYL